MPMGKSFGLAQIGQIAVPVRDLERAVEFYRDTLGMRLLFQAPPGLAFFDCGGIRLLLDAAGGEEFANHSSVIYYKVDDLQSSFDTLCDRGVRFEQGPHPIAKLADHELWMAFFKDPDDNVLAMMSEVPL